MLYWIFLGAFSILFISILYFRKELKTVKEKKKIDYFGSFFLITGLITLILLLSEGPFWGWVSPMNISLYAVCPILFILFFYSQTKIKQPIIIYSACKSMVFITGLIAFFISFGCYFSLCYFIFSSDWRK